MNVTHELESKKLDTLTERIRKNLSPGETKKTLGVIAYEGQRWVVLTQPWKKKKGIDRSGVGAGWKVREDSDGFLLFNNNKVALFLEEGTRAHGPVRAKFLYIPLRPGSATWRKGFVYGKDYVLAKWVKGIKPRHYLKGITKYVLKLAISRFREKMARAAA